MKGVVVEDIAGRELRMVLFVDMIAGAYPMTSPRGKASGLPYPETLPNGRAIDDENSSLMIQFHTFAAGGGCRMGEDPRDNAKRSDKLETVPNRTSA